VAAGVLVAVSSATIGAGLALLGAGWLACLTSAAFVLIVSGACLGMLLRPAAPAHVIGFAVAFSMFGWPIALVAVLVLTPPMTGA